VAAELALERLPEMKPGTRIRWKAGGSERSGTVWSAGPAARSVWVIPDGPYGSRKPVLVVWLHRDRADFYEETLSGLRSITRRPRPASVRPPFRGEPGRLSAPAHGRRLTRASTGPNGPGRGAALARPRSTALR
jgi:hypothetical protein